MILATSEIINRMAKGDIVIEPFDPARIGPNSYDVHLHEDLKIYGVAKGHGLELDPKKENPTEEMKIPFDGKILYPGNLYLARTQEYTETRNLVPMLQGRSSVGRLGIFIHVTAGFGDIGFCGTWTLEIMVIHPVRVYPGMKIGQIYWQEPVGIGSQYTGKYQGQIKPTASKMKEDIW